MVILPVKRSNPSLSLLFPCQTQCHFTVTCILPLTHSHQPYTHAAPSHTFASKWYGYLVIPPFMTSLSADTIPRSARALRRNQVCWMEIFPCSHLPLAESLSPVLSAKLGQLQTPDRTPNPKRSWTTLLIDYDSNKENIVPFMTSPISPDVMPRSDDDRSPCSLLRKVAFMPSLGEY